jgi:DME family drug/metabolite transporter
MRVRYGYILVLLGALLWGSVGVFSRALGQMGLTAMEIAALRMFIASVFIAPVLLVMGLRGESEEGGMRSPFRFFLISRRGLFWSALVGFFGLALASATYYVSIEHIGMSTSSVLMCTSPMFGIVLGRLLYGEGITYQKIVSLLFNVTGCILAVTGGVFTIESFSPIGVGMGICSGLMGCLLTMFSKAATRYAHPLTVVFYGFAAGAVLLTCFANPFVKISEGMPPEFYWLAVAFGLFPTALAYLFYMTGLSKGLEASKVPVIASFETVTAIVLGVVLFKESFGAGKLIGVGLVLASIGIMSIDMTNRRRKLLERMQQM